MIVTALCIASLCGMAGFAVDVGTLFRAKRNLQLVADAAAIAGADEAKYGDWKAAALASTVQNGITNGSGGATVTVNNPPASGSHAGGVEVIVTVSEPTYFMKIFHLTSMNVSARAVAGLVAASGCIYTLGTSDADIGMVGSADLSMPDCGILVDSSSSNAISMTNNTTITAQSIGVVGGISIGGADMTPAAITGIAPAADPLAFLPVPSFNTASCKADPGSNYGPTIPGGTVCYNGISITGSGNVTFPPGLYIVNGTFSIKGSGTVSGNGVTFFLAAPNGTLTQAGSSSLNLIAPTSGTYNGILFFEDPTDNNAMSIAGSGSSTIEGIIYAPDASLTLVGSSGVNIYADLIVNSLSMKGTSNYTFNNYSGINANEPLQTAVLTE
jgi:Putative Flp pilus-assembly TadE/G-like